MLVVPPTEHAVAGRGSVQRRVAEDDGGAFCGQASDVGDGAVDGARPDGHVGPGRRRQRQAAGQQGDRRQRREQRTDRTVDSHGFPLAKCCWSRHHAAWSTIATQESACAGNGCSGHGRAGGNGIPQAPVDSRPCPRRPPPPTTCCSLAVEATDGAARAGTVTTARGTFRTPCFMPVGTRGAVRTLVVGRPRGPRRPRSILGNTYHLMLQPGAELVAELGGLHGFADW